MNEQEEKLEAASDAPLWLRQMIVNYRMHAARHEDFNKTPHVKSVWFNDAQVKKIIKSYEDEGADGLRIYFGRYPDDLSAYPGLDNKHQQTNTVAFVTTHNGGSDNFKSGFMMDPENRGEQCQPNCRGEQLNDNPPMPTA